MIKTEEIQATTISVKTRNQSLHLIALNRPPRHNIKTDTYVDLLKKYGRRFIVGGDFNAKNTHRGSCLCTTKGRELLIYRHIRLIYRLIHTGILDAMLYLQVDLHISLQTTANCQICLTSLLLRKYRKSI